MLSNVSFSDRVCSGTVMVLSLIWSTASLASLECLFPRTFLSFTLQNKCRVLLGESSRRLSESQL